MMRSYQLVNSVYDGSPVAVKRDDGWQIPLDPANTDYQQYLAWLAEGNEPLPADEGAA
jgi:hypothetical protein